MPQRIRDYGVAAIALGVVLAALSALDGRVPARLTQAMEDVTSGRFLNPGSPIGNALASVSINPALDNYFVGGLVAAGLVLFVLMVRT